MIGRESVAFYTTIVLYTILLVGRVTFFGHSLYIYNPPTVITVSTELS